MTRRLSENTILRLIVLLPIVAAVLTSVVLTNLFINTEKASFENELKLINEQHISDIKVRIKNRVNRVIHVLNVQNQTALQSSRKQVKDVVYMGHKAIESLYEEYQEMNEEAILEEIKHHLRKIRFFKEQSGYFYIFKMDGTNVLHPLRPDFEGTNLLKVQDIKGKYIVKTITDTLKTKEEAFDQWYWYKNSIPTRKIGFNKLFKPLDIYIGTGMYYDDIYEQHLKDSLKLLNTLIYEDKNYIFAVNNEGVTLAHFNKKFINLPLKQMSKKGQEVVKGIIAQRDVKEGRFIEYQTMSIKNREKRTYKISFVKYVPELKLTIGTGFHTNQLDDTIKQKMEQLSQKLEKTTQKIVVTSFVVTAVLILLMLLVANSLRGILNNYAKELASKNADLEDLNNNLEQTVIKEVEKNRKKDNILNQQAKMAAMGEMLGNISHQWRQPLSVISSSASGIKYEDELGILDKEQMYKGLDKIVKNTKMLSETIDDFRNFFNPNKLSETFEVKTAIDKVLVLISSNLKNQNIDIITDIPGIKVQSHQNELIQALLNILNNAKDALCELEGSDKKYIFITVTENDNDVIIQIKDNAKGIQESILERIFEPYFTTKHQTHGTGIGLYMTKKIIHSNLQGEITIVNSQYHYDNSNYNGALCTIILPKKLKNKKQKS